MAYGIVHYFPGGNQAQYEASIAAVHPGRDIPPKVANFSRGWPI